MYDISHRNVRKMFRYVHKRLINIRHAIACQTRVAYSNEAKTFPLCRVSSAILPFPSRTRALLPPVVSFRIWVIVIRFSFGARSTVGWVPKSSDNYFGN